MWNQGGMPYFTVLGDIFMKHHYVVLSYGSDKADDIRVGLGGRSASSLSSRSF